MYNLINTNIRNFMADETFILFKSEFLMFIENFTTYYKVPIITFEYHF